jgi:hypothetical protein
MTLSEIASGLPAGQRNPSALGMKNPPIRGFHRAFRRQV